MSVDVHGAGLAALLVLAATVVTAEATEETGEGAVVAGLVAAAELRGRGKGGRVGIPKRREGRTGESDRAAMSK